MCILPSWHKLLLQNWIGCINFSYNVYIIIKIWTTQNFRDRKIFHVQGYFLLGVVKNVSFSLTNYNTQHHSYHVLWLTIQNFNNWKISLNNILKIGNLLQLKKPLLQVAKRLDAMITKYKTKTYFNLVSQEIFVLGKCHLNIRYSNEHISEAAVQRYS